jgi:hypothetical protein
MIRLGQKERGTTFQTFSTRLQAIMFDPNINLNRDSDHNQDASSPTDV